MEEIDQIYTEHIYYWARRISKELKRRGYPIGRVKTATYMQIMAICAMYPKKNTSIANKEHRVYPYLLRWVQITRANQVWSTDITYIKLPWGFVYLLAIIDRYSRKVIARDISITMDKEFCFGVLQRALAEAKPEIFNSDQWSQFTSNSFTNLLETAEVKISMDGVGRCFDNIRIERLWRTVKYEDIHLNDYQTPNDVYHGLSLYFNKYNNTRLHSSLGYRTPSEVYQESKQ
jgi:putative transposase